ncbi:MAG TPA: FkbM family methyltransferase [Phycisphaerae bacterium]|nr:FkbM family methyltransferase [Phycisphaerae bacterium]
MENEYGLLFSDQIGSISTVLDLGGNAGYSVRLWEQKYPDCRITVVEPDSANAKVCRNNIQIVQAESRIILLQACALGTSRNVWLDRSQPEWGYKATNKASPNEAPIRGMTLNEILVSSNLPDKIDLLKCDIEGAELELFRDCSDWISKFRFFAIETHTPYTPEQLVQDMQKNGCCVEVLQINNKIDDVLATVFAKAI